ncbi:MAG: hypothetical protein ABUS79_00120 [Pseudomonadota bacterium]
MGLELIGGAKDGDKSSEKHGEATGHGVARGLADAERLVVEARQRLGALANRLADLRLRLAGAEAVAVETISSETAGSVPVLEMPPT